MSSRVPFNQRERNLKGNLLDFQVPKIDGDRKESSLQSFDMISCHEFNCVAHFFSRVVHFQAKPEGGDIGCNDAMSFF